MAPPDTGPASVLERGTLGSAVGLDARLLSGQLRSLRLRLFPPKAQKVLRRFSATEASNMLGVSEDTLKELVSGAGLDMADSGATRRRLYSLEQVNQLRRFAASTGSGKIPLRRAPGHLQVVAVANFKGGSGKTTTSVHLSQYLALHGYKVLAVDLDPQASLSALLGHQPEIDIGENETFYAALRYDRDRRELREVIRPTYFPGLDLVAGNLELQEFEHQTPRMLAAKGAVPEFVFNRIASALNSVEQDYDVVVIDCPPQLGFLTLSALCAATGILVTVHPQMLDVASMSQFLLMTSDLLAVVQAAGGQFNYDWLRYLITRYEPQDGPQTYIVDFLRKLFGSRVLTSMVLKSTAISDAGLTKQTLYEVEKAGISRGTYIRAIESLDAVNRELELLMRQAWSTGT